MQPVARQGICKSLPYSPVKKRKITAVTLQQIDDNNPNSGTKLSKRGVFSLSDSGRGDKIRRRKERGMPTAEERHP